MNQDPSQLSPSSIPSVDHPLKDKLLQTLEGFRTNRHANPLSNPIEWVALEVSRLNHRNKIFYDAIGHRLVKNALIAELLQIHFQALQFQTKLIGAIYEGQRTKVGLACLGTDRGEFRTLDLNRIVAMWKWILKMPLPIATISMHTISYGNCLPRKCLPGE
mgnify:CR=1 FL=1